MSIEIESEKTNPSTSTHQDSPPTETPQFVDFNNLLFRGLEQKELVKSFYDKKGKWFRFKKFLSEKVNSKKFTSWVLNKNELDDLVFIRVLEGKVEDKKINTQIIDLLINKSDLLGDVNKFKKNLEKIKEKFSLVDEVYLSTPVVTQHTLQEALKKLKTAQATKGIEDVVTPTDRVLELLSSANTQGILQVLKDPTCDDVFCSFLLNHEDPLSVLRQTDLQQPLQDFFKRQSSNKDFHETFSNKIMGLCTNPDGSQQLAKFLTQECKEIPNFYRFIRFDELMLNQNFNKQFLDLIPLIPGDKLVEICQNPTVGRKIGGFVKENQDLQGNLLIRIAEVFNDNDIMICLRGYVAAYRLGLPDLEDIRNVVIDRMQQSFVGIEKKDVSETNKNDLIIQTLEKSDLGLESMLIKLVQLIQIGKETPEDLFCLLDILSTSQQVISKKIHRELMEYIFESAIKEEKEGSYSFYFEKDGRWSKNELPDGYFSTRMGLQESIQAKKKKKKKAKKKEKTATAQANESVKEKKKTSGVSIEEKIVNFIDKMIASDTDLEESKKCFIAYAKKSTAELEEAMNTREKALIQRKFEKTILKSLFKDVEENSDTNLKQFIQEMSSYQGGVLTLPNTENNRYQKFLNQVDNVSKNSSLSNSSKEAVTSKESVIGLYFYITFYPEREIPDMQGLDATMLLQARDALSSLSDSAIKPALEKKFRSHDSSQATHSTHSSPPPSKDDLLQEYKNSIQTLGQTSLNKEVKLDTEEMVEPWQSILDLCEKFHDITKDLKDDEMAEIKQSLEKVSSQYGIKDPILFFEFMKKEGMKIGDFSNFLQKHSDQNTDSNDLTISDVCLFKDIKTFMDPNYGDFKRSVENKYFTKYNSMRKEISPPFYFTRKYVKSKKYEKEIEDLLVIDGLFGFIDKNKDKIEKKIESMRIKEYFPMEMGLWNLPKEMKLWNLPREMKLSSPSLNVKNCINVINNCNKEDLRFKIASTKIKVKGETENNVVHGLDEKMSVINTMREDISEMQKLPQHPLLEFCLTIEKLKENVLTSVLFSEQVLNDPKNGGILDKRTIYKSYKELMIVLDRLEKITPAVSFEEISNAFKSGKGIKLLQEKTVDWAIQQGKENVSFLYDEEFIYHLINTYKVIEKYDFSDNFFTSEYLEKKTGFPEFQKGFQALMMQNFQYALKFEDILNRLNKEVNTVIAAANSDLSSPEKQLDSSVSSQKIRESVTSRKGSKVGDLGAESTNESILNLSGSVISSSSGIAGVNTQFFSELQKKIKETATTVNKRFLQR